MPKKDNPHGLNNKEAQFGREYLIDLNQTQAAIRAGYSEKTANVKGSQLLAKVNIQAFIVELIAERVERTEINSDSVLKDIQEIKERCMQKAPVLTRKGEHVEDEDGNKIWRFDSAGALKALEMLGKHVGIFEVHNHQKNTSEVTIFQLPDNGRDKEN